MSESPTILPRTAETLWFGWATRHEACYNSTHMQLRSAMLYVKHLERMRRFYRNLLGVEPANHNCTDVFATFDTGGLRFALHAIPADIAKNIEVASPSVPREN